MLATDESAVICDLAETYHIYDYRALPLKTLAALCVGLRDDSRIKLKLAGAKHSLMTYMMAMAVDHLSLLTWFQTEDAKRNRNRPASILQTLIHEPVKADIVAFESVEEFEQARKLFFEEG